MSMRFQFRRLSEMVAMDLAPGVTLQGMWHHGSRGSADAPAERGWVDVDTLDISGRPDLVGLWFFDACPDLGGWKEADCPQRAAFLEELADRLRDHHEEEVPS